jgi:hypothetical protein
MFFHGFDSLMLQPSCGAPHCLVGKSAQGLPVAMDMPSPERRWSEALCRVRRNRPCSLRVSLRYQPANCLALTTARVSGTAC